jgi:hypothetical protein
VIDPVLEPWNQKEPVFKLQKFAEFCIFSIVGNCLVLLALAGAEGGEDGQSALAFLAVFSLIAMAPILLAVFFSTLIFGGGIWSLIVATAVQKGMTYRRAAALASVPTLWGGGLPVFAVTLGGIPFLVYAAFSVITGPLVAYWVYLNAK